METVNVIKGCTFNGLEWPVNPTHQWRCSSTILLMARDTACSSGLRFLFRLMPSFSSRKSTMNSDPDTCWWLYSIQGILPCGDSFPSK